MNRFYVLLTVWALGFTIFGCTSTHQTKEAKPVCEEAKVDTLMQKLHQLDSVKNCGELVHLDIYKVGKLKSVEFTVQSAQFGKTTEVFINLEKDCGGEYYYSWENARLLPEECKYLLAAIKTIKDNISRSTDHEERYAYITKDNIRILASNSGNGNKWNVVLDVDYLKHNSEITLSESDLDELASLINAAQVKVFAIKK